MPPTLDLRCIAKWRVEDHADYAYKQLRRDAPHLIRAAAGYEQRCRAGHPDARDPFHSGR